MKQLDRFLGDVVMRQIGATNNIQLEHNLLYYSQKYQVIMIAKSGFISDLGSIPMWIRSFVGADNIIYSRAFIMHDLLYRNGFDRKVADLLLDEMLQLMGLRMIARNKIYYGLRMFGSYGSNEEVIANAKQYTTIIDYRHFKKKVNIKEEVELIRTSTLNDI